MIVFLRLYPIIEPVKRQRVLLFLFVLAIIFPMNWLREESAFLRTRLDSWFAPEWMHVIGHLALFSLLVFLILRVFHLPVDLRTLIVLLGVVLVVGSIQELLQLPTKGRAFGWPEIFDLGVDLIGGMLGIFFSLAYRWQRRSPST
jgi:hypothetical protein